MLQSLFGMKQTTKDIFAARFISEWVEIPQASRFHSLSVLRCTGLSREAVTMNRLARIRYFMVYPVSTVIPFSSLRPSPRPLLSFLQYDLQRNVPTVVPEVIEKTLTGSRHSVARHPQLDLIALSSWYRAPRMTFDPALE